MRALLFVLSRMVTDGGLSGSRPVWKALHGVVILFIVLYVLPDL